MQQGLRIHWVLFRRHLAHHQRHYFYIFLCTDSTLKHFADIWQVHFETVLILFISLLNSLELRSIHIFFVQIDESADYVMVHFEVTQRSLPLIAGSRCHEVKVDLVAGT